MLYINVDLDFPKNFYSSTFNIHFEYTEKGGLYGQMLHGELPEHLVCLQGMYLEEQNIMDVFFSTHHNDRDVFYSGKIVKHGAEDYCLVIHYLEDTTPGQAPCSGTILLWNRPVMADASLVGERSSLVDL